MPASKQVSYAGNIGYTIRLFTDTYNPLTNPWTFNPRALLPMDFGAHVTGGVVLSYEGNVFDAVAGVTNFKIGQPGGAGVNYQDFGTLLPIAGRLRGFTIPDGSQSNAVQYNDYPFPLGTDLALPSLVIKQVFTVSPPGANTGSPDPRCSNNLQTTLGVYTSGELSLDQFYLQYSPNGTLYQSMGLDLGFAPGDGLQNSIPVGGRNYAKQGYTFHDTDFISFDAQYTPNFEAPPGGYDIDGYMSSNQAAWNTTNKGWLSFNGDTATINGQVLDGFGILVAPDLSEYWIVRLVPTDAASEGFVIGNSTEGKFDDNGNLFLKPFVGGGTVFVSVSTVPVFRYLPVFPPIPIPDAQPDTEEALNLYRGLNK